MLQPLDPQRMLYTSRIAHHAISQLWILLAFNRRRGVTLKWPCNSSHLLVSFTATASLAHSLGSARAAAFAFQASVGSDEESLKTPLEAAVRIKASWLRNDFQHLTQYSGKLAWTSFLIAFFRRISFPIYCIYSLPKHIVSRFLGSSHLLRRHLRGHKDFHQSICRILED